MKKLFKMLMFLLAAVTLTTACQKDENESGAVPSTHFTINADMALARTAITDNGDGSYTPTWQKNDKLAVFFGFPTEDNIKVTFTNTAADGAVASFEATVNDISGEQTLYALYPANAFAKNYNSNETTGINVPGFQNPSLTSFDPAADILVAKPKQVTVAGTDVTINNMAFARMISVAKVILADATTESKLAAEKVLSVKIVSNSTYPVSGRMRVDMNTAKIVDYTVNNAEVAASYTAEDNFVINGTNAAYIAVNPITIPAGETVQFLIETENYEITKRVDLENDLAFPISNVAKITLNIKDSEIAEKDSETRIFVEAFDKATITKIQYAATETGVKGTGVSEALTYTYSQSNCNIRFNNNGQASTNPYLYINAAGSSMTISNIAVNNVTNLKFTAKVAQSSSSRADGYLTVRYKESSADEWNVAGIIASAASWNNAEASLGFAIANSATSIDLKLEGDAVMLVDDIVLEAGTYTNPDILTVSETALTLGNTAGATATFEVFANKAWTTSITGNGFTISPASGAAYTKTTVTVTATAAGGANAAELGAIAVTASEATASVTISQEAAPSADAKYYKRLTAELSDYSGKYLIVYNNNSTTGYLSSVTTGTTPYGVATTITIPAEGILSTDDLNAHQVTIAKDGTNYTLKFGGQYLYWKTDKNSLGKQAASYSWTILNDANGVRLSPSADNTRLLWWNNGNTRFACYTDKTHGSGGYTYPILYKLEE